MTPLLQNRRARFCRFLCALGMLWAGLALGTAEARVVEIVVLNTTDLHGAISHSPGMYAERNEGSLLQCATLVKREREKSPNLLLLDCGDIFQGTAASFQTRGGVIATAMNAMGYDAYVLGNHEFDWGLDALSEFMHKMNAPALAANMVASADAPDALRGTLPYLIKEVDGIRVAIVGLTTPNIPNWTRGLEEAGLTFLESRLALERTLPLVRQERPQVMILLVHQGYLAEDDSANQLNEISRRFGEFDLMLGGHLHAVSIHRNFGNVKYAQAGSGAEGVLKVILSYDTVAGEVTDKQVEFLGLKDSIPEDAEIGALVADDLAKADLWLGTVIGKTRSDLTSSTAMPGLSPVQQLICLAIAENTGVEAVLHDILSPKSIPAGDFRVADAWKLVPYENTAGVLHLMPAQIVEILEEGTAYLGTARYFGAWGLRYDLHPKAPLGSRIRNLRAGDGTPINGKKRIRVAFNSYHLSGGGGRFPTVVKAAQDPRCRLELVNTPVRDMVVNYVRRHRSIAIPAGTNATIVLTEPRAWNRREKKEEEEEEKKKIQ